MYYKPRIPGIGARYPVPRLYRILTCFLNRRRLIFTILIVNLIFFVFMYLMSTPENDEAYSKKGEQIEHGRLHLDAGEFIYRDGNFNLEELPHRVEARRKEDELRANFPGAKGVLRPNVDIFDYKQDACEDLVHPPKSISQSYKWYPMNKSSRSTFVFSAYLDTRTIPYAIKIHGISYGLLMEDFSTRQYCQIWYQGKKGPEVSRALYEIVPETHDFKYAPAFYVCYVRHSDSPIAVSLTSKKCAKATHFLPVAIPPQTPKPEYNFTICLSSPLNLHLDDIHHFVETVEMNRILGADKIVLYNHSTGARLDQYIKRYIKDGVIDLIPWKVPVAVNVYPPDPLVSPEIHYFAQVTAINDCLYRYMYRSKYMVFLDLDEFLVPRIDKTWGQLMSRLFNDHSDTLLNSRRHHKYGAFLIRNTFFRIDWPNDKTFEHKTDNKLQLRTQLTLVRESQIWDWYSRTKCIVLPSMVDMMGIHFVFSFLDNSHYVHKQVEQDVALLHHYREWGNEDDIVPPSEMDPYMLFYKDDLQDAVIKMHNQIGLLHIKN